MMKNTSNKIITILAIFLTVCAEAQERRPVDPSGPFARRAGQITQLDSAYDKPLSKNEVRTVGNATIISPCRLITNYHVAFGKSNMTDNFKAVMIKNRAIGHEVNFSFDIDKAGNFNRTLKAKVVGFANFIKSDAGVLGDIAVLELETCLDETEYCQLDLTMAESRSDVPVGALMTVSTAVDAKGRNYVLVQEGCKSEEVTPIDGLFVANCEAEGGMSGSAIYEMGADKKWHWTGLHAAGNEGNRTIAINAKRISEFLRMTFGK